MKSPPSSAQSTAKRRAVRWPAFTMTRQETIAGYLFATPALLGLLAFTAVPILASLALIFLHYDLLTPPKWAGLDNITRLTSDKRMFTIYWNTFRLVVGTTVLNNIIGLLLAAGVNRSMPGVLRYVLRTSIFFPVLTTTASLAVVWRFLLTQDRGVVNYLISQIGLGPVPWLSSSTWALVSAMIYDVWKSAGYLMVIYLAGLQGIPEVYYEAAKIDGAGKWQQFLHVTLPLISPTAFFAIVISLIGAFQIFDNVWVLTEGGPGDASRVIAIFIYEKAFRGFEMGYASAVSFTLFLILIVLTLFQFIGARRWVHYE
ncbi:MAG: sugar ABC transporter permease [Caldilineaceae bacterium]|nr:sugar ABC transporter permease [Caldilineaceae bacterium]HRJ45272.1 sugar ABC transporter permease [Caldilineaceae bacterium]